MAGTSRDDFIEAMFRRVAGGDQKARTALRFYALAWKPDDHRFAMSVLRRLNETRMP